MLPSKTAIKSSSVNNFYRPAPANRAFIMAIIMCIKNDEFSVAMYLTDRYLASPQTDKSLFQQMLKQHLDFYLCDKAANGSRQKLLHLLCKTNTSEHECHPYADFIKFLHSTYQENFVFKDLFNKSPLEYSPQIGLEMEASLPVENHAPVLPISLVEWQIFTRDQETGNILSTEVILSNIAQTENLSQKMDYLFSALRDSELDTYTILQWLKESFHLFLHKQACTRDGKNLLHLLSSIQTRKDDEHRAAHYAGQIVLHLVENYQFFKASVNSVDLAHSTPLDTAVFNDNPYVASALMQYGATVDCCNDFEQGITIQDKVRQTFNPELRSVVLDKQFINLPPLFNRKNVVLDVFIKLIKNKNYGETMEVLRLYLADGQIKNKLNNLLSGIQQQQATPFFNTFLANTDLKDNLDNNLFGIFCYGNWDNEDDAKEALRFLDSLLSQKSPKNKPALFDQMNTYHSTPIGSAIFANSDYSYLFVALYLKHGATNVENYKVLATEQMNKSNRGNLLLALDNKIDIESFLSTKQSCVMC